MRKRETVLWNSRSSVIEVEVIFIVSAGPIGSRKTIHAAPIPRQTMDSVVRLGTNRIVFVWHIRCYSTSGLDDIRRSRGSTNGFVNSCRPVLLVKVSLLSFVVGCTESVLLDDRGDVDETGRFLQFFEARRWTDSGTHPEEPRVLRTRKRGQGPAQVLRVSFSQAESVERFVGQLRASPATKKTETY
jgi:hypothetical protein